jgi:signal transduction histidine kinase
VDSIAVIIDDISVEEENISLKITEENNSRLLTSISHEMRTPVNEILGFVQLIEKKVTDKEVVYFLS